MGNWCVFRFPSVFASETIAMRKDSSQRPGHAKRRRKAKKILQQRKDMEAAEREKAQAAIRATLSAMSDDRIGVLLVSGERRRFIAYDGPNVLGRNCSAKRTRTNSPVPFHVRPRTD